jgi:hypothetical protein
VDTAIAAVMAALTSGIDRPGLLRVADVGTGSGAVAVALAVALRARRVRRTTSTSSRWTCPRTPSTWRVRTPWRTASATGFASSPAIC